MKTKAVRLTETQMLVLLQGLEAIGWEALPEWHEERKAAQTVKRILLDARIALATSHHT